MKRTKVFLVIVVFCTAIVTVDAQNNGPMPDDHSKTIGLLAIWEIGKENPSNLNTSNIVQCDGKKKVKKYKKIKFDKKLLRELKKKYELEDKEKR